MAVLKSENSDNLKTFKQAKQNTYQALDSMEVKVVAQEVVVVVLTAICTLYQDVACTSEELLQC